jgi:hypothetical protein
MKTGGLCGAYIPTYCPQCLEYVLIYFSCLVITVNRLCFVFVMLTAGLYWNVKRLHDYSSISLHNFFKFGYICVV